MGREASPKLFFEVLLLGNWNNDMKKHLQELQVAKICGIKHLQFWQYNNETTAPYMVQFNNVTLPKLKVFKKPNIVFPLLLSVLILIIFSAR